MLGVSKPLGRLNALSKVASISAVLSDIDDTEAGETNGKTLTNNGELPSVGFRDEAGTTSTQSVTNSDEQFERVQHKPMLNIKKIVPQK